MTLSQHEAFFASYAQSFCEKTEDSAMLHLKILHTEHVVKHMRVLTQQEPELIPYARPCILAALYHDIGRFEQFLQYKTFKDAHSVNHATQGVKVLKQHGVLADESKEVRGFILAAIGMHNRARIPQGLSLPLKNIAQAVRDADKFDILRIMAEHFSAIKDAKSVSNAVTFYAKDEPLLWSETIVQDILHNRLASYDHIVYINDFKLVLGSWVHDMNYMSTRKAVHASGYLHTIMHSLPDAPSMHAARARIFSLLKQSLI